MRRKSFAIVAMLVITAALMSSVIPSGGINVAFAEKDNYSQESSSEEDRYSEDESNHEEEEDEEEDRDSTRSNDEHDDDEEDSEDNTRSDDDGKDNDDEENGDNGDSSETGTEQENEQKNVCSGWAVCINLAENAEDVTATGADVASTTSETPFQLAMPI
jgi:cytoskeletal protein RodZ